MQGIRFCEKLFSHRIEPKLENCNHSPCNQDPSPDMGRWRKQTEQARAETSGPLWGKLRRWSHQTFMIMISRQTVCPDLICTVPFPIPCSWLQRCNPEASSWGNGFLIRHIWWASFWVMFLGSVLQTQPTAISKPFQKTISTNFNKVQILSAKNGVVLLSVKNAKW